jgi:energy-coupling factor transporter transmembrane protein EcfT
MEMAIEITIPIFETFRALDPNLRVCIAFVLLSALLFVVTNISGKIEFWNPFTWAWILFAGVSVIFGYAYLFHVVVDVAPSNFNLISLPDISLPDVAWPIKIRVI